MRIQALYVWMLLVCTVSIFSSNSSAATSFGRSEIVAIQNARTADLVILGSGFDSGLRQGMIYGVSRGSVTVGSVLLVELRSTLSAALILDLNPGQSLTAGDQIEIKILKT